MLFLDEEEDVFLNERDGYLCAGQPLRGTEGEPTANESSSRPFGGAGGPGATRPECNRRCVRVLQDPPPHVNDVPCLHQLLTVYTLLCLSKNV